MYIEMTMIPIPTFIFVVFKAIAVVVGVWLALALVAGFFYNGN